MACPQWQIQDENRHGWSTSEWEREEMIVVGVERMKLAWWWCNGCEGSGERKGRKKFREVKKKREAEVEREMGELAQREKNKNKKSIANDQNYVFLKNYYSKMVQ